MSTTFLFVNENEASYPVRPKRPLTSVRRHVRLQRGRNAAYQRQPAVELRALPPKALQVCTSKSNEELTLRTSTNRDRESRDTVSENPSKRLLRVDVQPTFKISYRIWQRYPDACKLIVLYLSGEGSPAHLALRCTTQWSTMVIQKALESECHTLFLLCYISSIITYQENLEKAPGSSNDGRHSSQSSDTSSSRSSFSPTLDDLEFTCPFNSQETPYTSPLSSFVSPTLQQPNPFTISQSLRPSHTPQASFSPNYVSSNCSHTTQFDLPRSFPSVPISSHCQTEAYLYTIGNKPSYTLPSDPIHLTHQAVATLKSRLSIKLKSLPPPPLSEFLFPVWCLFRSAILQNDFFAAEAHEKFMRHLLYKSDGAIGVPPWLLRIIVEVDLKLGGSDGGEDLERNKRSELILESEMRERGHKRSGDSL